MESGPIQASPPPPTSPPPPKPAPKKKKKPTPPTDSVQMIALHPFSAEDPKFLSLETDDLIEVVQQTESGPGWWKGRCKGKVGFFPSNFCMVLPPLPQVPKGPATKKRKGAPTPEQQKQEPKKKKVKSDIQRPKSAYVFYCGENRTKVKEEMGDAKPTDVIRELAKKWGDLSQDEKQKYVEMSNRDKERYVSQKDDKARLAEEDTFKQIKQELANRPPPPKDSIFHEDDGIEEVEDDENDDEGEGHDDASSSDDEDDSSLGSSSDHD